MSGLITSADVNVSSFLCNKCICMYVSVNLKFVVYYRNGVLPTSGTVNRSAVVNPEQLDGEELLKHIRGIIAGSSIDENIKVEAEACLKHQNILELS